MGKIFSTDHKLKGFRKIFLLSLVAVFSIVIFQTAYSVPDIGFDPIQTLNENDQGAIAPEIETFGNNVYTVWKDGSGVVFRASTNMGDSFNPIVILSSSTANLQPKLDAFGDNVYSVWKNDVNILFTSSTNKGSSFFPPVLLSNNPTSPQSQQIVTSGNNDAYVVWRDGNQILFRASADDGVTFSPDISEDPKVINIPGANTKDPQVASSGNNVYIIWEQQSKIKFAKSTDNGSTFSIPVNLGNTLLFSGKPQISTTGANVYVAWQDGLAITFAGSKNNGQDFVNSAKSIGDVFSDSSPQIASTGDNVHIVWQSLTNIQTSSSTNNGDSFFVEDETLHSDAGSEGRPQISASGINVQVVWQGKTFGNDIWFAASDDNGATYSSPETIENNDGNSQLPQLSTANNKVHVVWQDFPSTVSDIFYTSGISCTVCVSFDELQYKLSDTATITVIDTSSSGGPLSVTVTSDSDPTTGVNVDLTEIGSTGEFVGQLTFTTDASSGTTLKAAPGDSITAELPGGQSGTANIFSIDVQLCSGISPLIFCNVEKVDLGSIAHVVVEDQNSNVDTSIAETIDVTVTTNFDSTGITITLTETGIDTGVFGGSGQIFNNEFIFMEKNNLYELGDVLSLTTIIISQDDDASNTDSSSIQAITVDVGTSTDLIGTDLQLLETGLDSGSFQGILALVGDPINEQKATALGLKSIDATEGDFVSVTHTLTTRGLVIPNPDPSRGAIQVNVPKDDVIASYKGVSTTVPLEPKIGEGGGGGGLVRPGLVVNLLGGSILFGGSGGGAHPTFGDASLMVLENPTGGLGGIISDENTNSLELTQVVETGQDVVMRFKLSENQGINNLERFRMFLNFEGESYDASTIDTHVTYERGDKITKVDPHEKIDKVEINILEEDPWNLIVNVRIVFKNTFNTSILVESWDLDRNSGKKLFPDALRVEENSILLPDTIKEFVKTTPFMTQTEIKEIPIWVKSNALWWKQKQIDDSDFVAGIEYLIHETIIQIPENNISSSVTIHEIPDWIREVAGFWSDNSITDDDFVQAMQWLITNGILKVQT